MFTVELAGKKYRIDINSWQGRDISDFSPRASVPGSGAVFSELGIYQPIAQSDFRHGFGFQWMTDEAGYLRTEGNIDTRHEGVVLLFTKATTGESMDKDKEGAVVFGSYIYFWSSESGNSSTGAGVRRWSPGSGWEAVPIQADPQPAINTMYVNGAYLFVCPDGGRIKKAATISNPPVAGDWSDAGANANSTDYKWGVMHAGLQYFGKDGASDVYTDSADDLSTLYGTPADDTQEIKVGAGNIPTITAVSFIQSLMVGSQNGLYAIGEDRIARMIINLTSEASSNNFRSMAVQGGLLYFPVRDKLYRWTGSNLVDISPRRLTDSFPFTTYGQFDNLVPVGRFLFCTARTNEATYTESILCYDGVGWHRLLDTITDGDGSTTMLVYDPLNNRLWFHVAKAASGATYYVPFQSLSEFPYADFPTTGTNRLVTSRIDAGFRRITKSAPRMFVTGSNLTNARYIRVSYSLDGGDIIFWDDVKSDGVTELDWPAKLMTIEFDYINLYFQLVTDAAGQSPVLESYALMVLMRPDVKYGYSFDVTGASEAEQGGLIDPRSSAEIKGDLRNARDSKRPIKLVSPFGEEIWGYITALNEKAVEYHGEMHPNAPSLEMVIRVNFVEVLTPGVE